MKFCKIGIHKWNEVPVAQFEMMYSKALVYGDVCIHCGKHRESFESEVHGMPHPEKWEPYAKEVKL